VNCDVGHEGENRVQGAGYGVQKCGRRGTLVTFFLRRVDFGLGAASLTRSAAGCAGACLSIDELCGTGGSDPVCAGSGASVSILLGAMGEILCPSRG
jgi:hypothetical protein